MTQETFEALSRRRLLKASAVGGLVATVPVGQVLAGRENNDANREADRPHVDYEVDGWEVTLEFVNPTRFTWLFDLQIDGEPEGTEDQCTDQEISQGPLEGQCFGLRYEPITLGQEESETRVVTAREEVRVRLARGPEQGWYFDWLTIDPERPEARGDCMRGGHADYGFRNQGQCVRFVNTGKDSR
jgi:hypothetical protein